MSLDGTGAVLQQAGKRRISEKCDIYTDLRHQARIIAWLYPFVSGPKALDGQ
ncbi:MAG: hypothetical protein WBA90_13165 [Albidovulum sp.]